MYGRETKELLSYMKANDGIQVMVEGIIGWFYDHFKGGATKLHQRISKYFVGVSRKDMDKSK